MYVVAAQDMLLISCMFGDLGRLSANRSGTHLWLYVDWCVWSGTVPRAVAGWSQKVAQLFLENINIILLKLLSGGGEVVHEPQPYTSWTAGCDSG